MTNDILLGLTPAEALFILSPERSGGRKMAELTIRGLILERVLAANKYHGATIIEPGSLFGAIELKPHQEVIANYFVTGAVTKRLAKALAARVGGYPRYKTYYVRASLIERGCLRKEVKTNYRFFRKTGYPLTPLGQETRSNLTRLLDEGETRLSGWLKSDPVRAKAYLVACGANLLLLPSHCIAEIEGYRLSLANVQLTGSTLLHYREDIWFGAFLDLADHLGRDFDLDFDVSPVLDFDFNLDFDFGFDFGLDFDFDFDFDFD